MNDLALLNKIRILNDGGQVDDNQAAAFLWKQCCYFHLARIPSEKEKVLSNIISNQVRIANQYKECQNIITDFEEIPYAIIKGAVLADQIYPSVGYHISKVLFFQA